MQTSFGNRYYRSNHCMLFAIVLMSIIWGCNAMQPKYDIVDRDIENKQITIKFSSSDPYVTDSDCLEAANAIHELCLEGYEVKVEGWCPSAKNPITLEWAEKLVDAKGKPVPVKENESD